MIPVTATGTPDGGFVFTVNSVAPTAQHIAPSTSKLACHILRLPFEINSLVCEYLTPHVRVKVQKKSHAYHGEAYSIDVLNKNEWGDFFNYSITCTETYDKNAGAIKSAHKAHELAMIMDMEDHSGDPTLPLQVCPRCPRMSEGLIPFLNKFTRLEVSTAITMAKTKDTSTSDNPEDDVIVKRIKVLIDLTTSREDLAPHPADINNILSITNDILYDTTHANDAAAFREAQESIEHVIRNPLPIRNSYEVQTSIRLPYLTSVTGEGLFELGRLVSVHAEQETTLKLSHIHDKNDLVICPHEDSMRWLRLVAGSDDF
ncbi:hypothetical protein TI39_contig4202g00058 [Zymoseptoria brevis]|uniref:Uncharacterized protein n=1 Tax=Zymoseptoria brevis TaxID=1047168 RepID=A0A0F4GAG7_9PEZI|nr:hypothetical protein TI39_contig4202g00058 [Zymoseptoria brevis]